MKNNHLITSYERALRQESLDKPEVLELYTKTPLADLIWIANEIRKTKHSDGRVTWIIDRNVNITNVCIAGCKFCNFSCSQNDEKAYITSIEQYKQKIDALYAVGGKQLLLQGGLHPGLGLGFYTRLFSTLKQLYPDLKLHALGPPEIVHIAQKENKSYRTVLEELVNAGLDSLPGAGAEILNDRVRKLISPAKCNTNNWLDVMKQAHQMGLVTSATMMFGHIETIEERIEHLLAIRNLQAEKPDAAPGFIAFIAWPFQPVNTRLRKQFGINSVVTALEYIRLLAVSRIVLSNIDNIQASWLTVGKSVAQICLHTGANDLGSVMLEENVVSAAGSHNRMDSADMQQTISGA